MEKKILVVDDKCDILEVIKAALQAYQITNVRLSQNMEEAISTLEMNSDWIPDVILSDVDMATKDEGFRFLNWFLLIKEKSEKFKNTKFFLMSGEPQEVRELIDKKQLDGFFEKPFSIIELVKGITK